MYQHLFVSSSLSKDTHELSHIHRSQEQHLGATCVWVEQSQAPEELGGTFSAGLRLLESFARHSFLKLLIMDESSPSVLWLPGKLAP